MMTSIGKTLKNFRKEHGLTQKDLSQNICSQSVLSRIENGEEIPNIIVIQQLCQRLGISIDQLIGDLFPDEVVWRKCFNKMFMYLRQERYLEIEAILEYLTEKHTIYLEKDRLQQYYFEAVCLFFIHHQPEQALQKVLQGVNILYGHHYQGFFDYKILLLSFAGKMNQFLEQFCEADKYYREAYQLYQSLMADYSEKTELVNLFTNYGDFLLQQEHLKPAEKVIDTGLAWCRQQHSYYRLPELLNLKILVLQKQGLEIETKQYRERLMNIHLLKS